MANRDYNEPLKIGYSGDEDWETMQRADQRIVLFHVAFQELPFSSPIRDYRACLEHLWSAFLRETHLSACILHQSWHPERGPDRKVIGWVWRQHGREQLVSLTEPELFQLTELLRAPDSGVSGFVITEQMTTDRCGKHCNQRKLRFSKGTFTVEPFSE